MKIFRYISILLILLFSFACTGEGIFYTLRDEVRIANAAFDDEADIFSVFDVDHDSNAGTPTIPIAQGRSLWYKESSSWKRIGFPDSIDNHYGALTSAVEFQGDIYASFRYAGSSSIWSYDIATKTWTLRNSGGTLPDADDMYYLFSGDSLAGIPDSANLYVNRLPHGEVETVTSRLYHFTTPSLTFSGSEVSIDGSTTIDMPVLSMDFDGTDYWLVANKYEGDSGLLLSTNLGNLKNFNSQKATGQFRCVELISNSGNNLTIAGTFDSKIHYREASDFAAVYQELSIGDGWINCIVDLNPSATGIILVGITDRVRTVDQGYEIISYSNADSLSVTSNIADDANYNSSNLRSSEVNDVLYIMNGASDYTLIAGTTKGLWKYESVDHEWNQE